MSQGVRPTGLGDTGTSVDDKDYQVPFAFTGKIDKITDSGYFES